MFNLTKEEEERADRLHRESIVVDTMANHIPSIYVECSPAIFERMNKLIEKRAPTAAILYEMDCMHIQELISGSRKEQEWMELSGVDALSMTIGIYGEPLFSFESAVRDIAVWTRKIDSVDYLVKATSVEDIYQAKKVGKKAIILAFQNTDHIGADLNKLDLFYDLGVRIIQLTYNLQNLVGSGGLERVDGGLSYFGVQVVKRLNELGILIDVSHCGYQTMKDTINISSAPVAATHDFCRSLVDNPRGKTDEQLKMLADNNGYIGMLAVPFFLGMQASLDDFLDHLDHAVEIMGADKVGIGADYGRTVPRPLQVILREEALKLGHGKAHTGGGGAIKGYKDIREWPNFTRGLVSRGYSDDEIKGILGGNALRILKEVVG